MTHLLIVSKVNGVKYVYDYCSSSFEKIESEIDDYLSTVPDELEPFCRIQVIDSMSKNSYELQEEDSYFEDAKFVLSLKELYSETKKLLMLNSVDIASYILCRYPSIHAFTIQKVLYYLYAEYLCKYGKSLFEAQFIAFDNGPVERTVYRKFTYEKDELLQNDSWKLKLFQCKEDMTYIDTILSESVVYFDKIHMRQWHNEKYNFTHRKNTPWSLAYTKGQNSIISDDLILNNHYLEL